MQVHGMFANNGEAETILGSDMSQVELLGSGSPSGLSFPFIYVGISVCKSSLRTGKRPQLDRTAVLVFDI